MSRPRQTSLAIAAAVAKRGMATIDDLMEDFPHLARGTLSKCLSNAKSQGLVRHARVGSGRHGHTIPGIYAPPLTPDHIPLVSSVWDLANPTVGRTWSGGEGRKFNLLGPWDQA